MASSIVSSAAKELGFLAVREIQYLYDVSDKIEGLRRDLLWMGCFLEDADNIENQQKLVRIWISEIRDFAYEAQDIVEMYLHQVSHHRQNGKWNAVKWFSCCLFDVVALHKVGSKIDNLRSRIWELINNLRLYGVKKATELVRSEHSLAMKEKRRTYSHTKENPIGLETHIKEVVKKLVENNEVRVVDICGTGGLGKTTLARQVFQDEVINKHFEKNCVWVYISKQFEKKAVFKEILFGLKCNSGAGDKDSKERDRIEKLGDEELAREICDVLKDKKCLVVLDDMWKKADWDILKPAFDFTTSLSSKLLITTRTTGLLKHAAPGSIGYSHPFGTLKDEDSWKLLESILFPREKVSGNKDTALPHDTSNNNAATSKEEGQAGEEPTRGRHQNYQTEPHEVENKKKLAKEMLKHCKGLPLAIRALGGVLLSKEAISEWKTVQKNIAYYLMSNREQESGSEGLSGVLESSYNELPYYLKPCFLYMGMYPEDHEIVAEELFHLWEAEGLVTASLDGGDELHDVLLDDIAEMYLNQLVERSMVQVDKIWPNGRIKSCRLHDIVRDMCLKKCREGNFLNIIEREISTESSNLTARGCLLNRRVRRCVMHDSRHLDPLLDPDLSSNTPCIRSLIVFAPRRRYKWKLVSENKRKLLSQLRVLYISKDPNIADAERIVRDSIHLRFLKVGGTIDCTPLRPWKCFDFSACFWEWKYLETLDLSDCYIYDCSSKFCMKLERLRHLYLPKKLRFKDSGKLCLSTNQLRQIETLKHFDLRRCEIEDLKQMNNLRNFSFCRWHTVDGKALEVLLKSPVITRKPLVVPFDLRIDAETMNKDPSILIKSEAIYIKELKVEGRINGNVVDAKAPFPHSLEEVNLEECEISAGGISVLGNLPRLKRLTLVGNAIEGNSMSFSDGSFPCLERLDLCRMKNLKEWEVGEGTCPSLEEVFLKECEISTGVITVLGKLPRLKRLVIVESAIEANRMSFFDGSFPCLEHLQLMGMKNLKEWEVGEGTCPSLEEVFLEECEISSGVITVLGKLPRLRCLELVCEISSGVITVLGKLPRLRCLELEYNVIEGNRKSFSNGSFPCLESLKVVLYDYEISSGFITLLGNLPRLNRLELRGCAIEGNKMTFSDGSFPCLEHLELSGMENLKEWEVGEGTCPSLRQLGIDYSPKLKLIPEGLPNSLRVECSPCVKGCEKYGGCRSPFR